MSCCNNPTVKNRSEGDQSMIGTYCPLAENTDTNMFVNYRVYPGKTREGYCSTCVGTMDYTRNGYANLNGAYDQANFPCPTGGRSFIGISCNK